MIMNTALVGFLGVIVGALVSFLATLIVSRRQNDIALKNIKISVLQNKISKAEIALDKISSVKMEVGTGNVLPQQMIGAAFVAFSEKVASSQQCHHYLSKELTSKLNTISAEVSEVIYKGKTGEDLDVESVKELFTKVQKIEPELRNQMQSKLTDWQLELDAELNI